MSQECTLEGVVMAAQTMGMLFSLDPKLDAGASALLDALADMDVDAVADGWPSCGDDDVRDVLAELRGASAGDRTMLAAEYRRLFVGPESLDAPPYGSVYTDRDQVVFGESTLALRSWMRRVGIGADGLQGAPEDHIGTMLLLLSWVAANKPHLVDEYLSGHLLTWAPHYLEQLEAHAGDGFYGILARLTRQTLNGMQKECNVRVVLPRFYR
jgi:TorA maturation chaperone TorD